MEKEKEFKQPFVIRLIEMQDKHHVVFWSNGGEETKIIDDFIKSVLSLPIDFELQIPQKNSIIQTSKYQNIYFIAYYFSLPDIRIRNFVHNCVLTISSERKIYVLENMKIFHELTDFIYGESKKLFDQFKIQFVHEYQKLLLKIKNNPENSKIFEERNTKYKSILSKLQIDVPNDGLLDSNQDLDKCLLLNEENNQSEEPSLQDLFNLQKFGEKANQMSEQYENWLFDRYETENKYQKFHFLIGKMNFIQISKYLKEKNEKLENSNIKLLNLSKIRVLDHLLYALHTGRTLIFKTTKNKNDVIEFSKKLGMLCPFWNENEHLKIFDKEISIDDARSYSIVMCSEFSTKFSKEESRYTFVDWDLCIFKGILCPNDSFITKITDSNHISNETMYLMILCKRFNDVSDHFVSLLARFDWNVPTSNNKAKQVLREFEFSIYDEDILLFWTHFIVSKQRRPVLLSFRNKTGTGFLAFPSNIIGLKKE